MLALLLAKLFYYMGMRDYIKYNGSKYPKAVSPYPHAGVPGCRGNTPRPHHHRRALGCARSGRKTSVACSVRICGHLEVPFRAVLPGPALRLPGVAASQPRVVLVIRASLDQVQHKVLGRGGGGYDAFF